MSPTTPEILERINAQSKSRFAALTFLKKAEFSLDNGQKRALIFVGVAAVAISLLLLLSAQARPNAQVIAAEPEPHPSTSMAISVLVVDVQGEVMKPGLYQLPPGARVADAIKAAGGVRKGSATSSVNLARFVEDGEQVFVAASSQGAGAESLGSDSFPSAGNFGGKLNINRATVTELDGLPGVGPVLAKRIIEYRSANGSFSSVDELQKVSGIGPSKFNELRKFVTV